jgi:hypothetical protein
MHRERLTGELRQRGLGVEGIDMRRPTIGEDVDDTLGFGSEVGVSRRQRAGGSRLLEDSREADLAESGAEAAPQVTSSNR